VNDPAGVQLAALRVQQATSPPGTNSAAAVAARVAAAAAAGLQGLGVGVGVPGLGAVQNEDIRVPDKMVGLSKCTSNVVNSTDMLASHQTSRQF
jgi:hypothetical protein